MTEEILEPAMATKKLPDSVRKLLSEAGHKGGKKGSHADKVRAGKLAWQARLAKAKANGNPTNSGTT